MANNTVAKLWIALAIASTGHVLAQTAPAETASVPATVASPAQTPAEGCRPLTDKAMAADMRALTAQSQRADVAEQARLYTESVGLWTKAVGQCEGRAKERAQRNLTDDQRITAGLTEQLGAGPECAAAHKDGTSLQELARAALGERRWSDASAFFRKAEDTWDLAVERCTGSQRDIANNKRAQSEIDGYNAERCAPLFDRARDYTQKLRSSAAVLAKEEKQDQLMIAETLWRDALAQCEGSAAKDSASNNAQALARERGTPFVAKAPPVPPPLPTPATPSQASAKAIALTPQSAAIPTRAALSGVSNSTPVLPPSANAGLTGSALSSAFAAAFPSANKPAIATAETIAATPIAPAAPQAIVVKQPTPRPPDFMAGGTRFQGKFFADVEGHTFSGNGKITWANGDVFDGDLQKGQRHGKGLFIWANGNRYNGDWVEDSPRGTGILQFANGNLYEGEVVNGTPKGKGRMAYASGDSYVGQFEAGVPQGKGLYVWKNGQQFEGDWANGKSNGQGRLKFASGDVFEGAVREGSPQGQGTFTWTNGDKYVGQWQAGKKHGEGTFTWRSGDYWQGVYENDQQTANGRLVQKE
jgi:hypothetical protein